MKINIYFILVFVFSSCMRNTEMQEFGILEGTVYIGPLCPVESNPPDPSCQPTKETFEAYSLAVFDTKHQEINVTISPAVPSGFFSIELTEGNYVLDYKDARENHIGSDNLPIEFSIKPSEVVILNIEIDTGIR